MREQEMVIKEVPICCKNCPYGRNHEFCFPCLKDLLGQEGIKAWKEKNGKMMKQSRF